MLDEPINEDIKNIILVDIPRTYPDNIYFQPNSDNQKTLFRILCAFAACNPDIGYCQVCFDFYLVLFSAPDFHLPILFFYIL